MQIDFNEHIPIIWDHTTINISKNIVMLSREKYILFKYHFLRENVAKKEVKMDFVETKEKITNIFTNPFPKKTFQYLKQKLGVVYPSS